MRADMGAGRGAGGVTDCRDPARIARGRVLRLLIDFEGIAGSHQRERTESIVLRQSDFVGYAAQMGSDAIGRRRAKPGADLGGIDADGDPAGRINFHRAARTIGAGAVILGGTSDPGTDEQSRLPSARLRRSALAPDRVLLELV